MFVEALVLTKTAEHAVRAVIVLAREYGSRPVSAEEIAAILGAPQNYLSKTLNALARRGLLTSARGPRGGFSLAVSPDVLTVADVVDVFAAANITGPRCVLRDAKCDPSRPCSAHRRWTELTRTAREPLLRTTIRELCDTEDATAGASATTITVRPTVRTPSHQGRTT